MIELTLAIIRVYEILLLIRIISSWVTQNPQGEPMRSLYQITDPYLNLFRKALPFLAAGGMDFTPIVGLLVLHTVSNILMGGL